VAKREIQSIDGGAMDSRPARSQPEIDPGAIERLAQLVQDFGSTLDLDEVLENVARGIKGHVDYDTFAVLLLDELGQQLRFRFDVGFPEEVVERWVFGLGQGIVGTAAATQQVVSVGDVRNESSYINAQSEIRSELAIPLIVKSRTIGVLDVGSREPHHFTEAHRRLLEFLAGHLANGIEHARLYENVREQASTLSLLHEVSRDLTSILDREKLLNHIARLIKRLINYQMFAVMLWNEEEQILEHTFSLRYDKRFMKQKGGFRLGHGVTGNAAALRQAVRVPNVHLNPHYTECGHGVEVRSELAVPLVFKDRLIGVLDLESVEYNAFSDQHEQMLSTLASYVAVALENARLYEKVLADEQRLEADLEMAREIQNGLLPRAPRVAGMDIAQVYRPARELGGDFYDFLPYGENRIAIAVGDAAGKGTPAALHGSMAVGVLRGHVVERRCGPGTILGEMNRQLGKPRIDNRFVAMAFAVYDGHDRTLTLANAGFTHPWLVRGGRVEELHVDGVPLGMLGEVTYEERREQLLPGDVVVFTSDGITEAVDPNCEEFGARRLQSRLVELAGKTAQEIADGLMETTEAYNSDLRPSDDRTIVVLKIE